MGSFPTFQKTPFHRVYMDEPRKKFTMVSNRLLTLEQTMNPKPLRSISWSWHNFEEAAMKAKAKEEAQGIKTFASWFWRTLSFKRSRWIFSFLSGSVKLLNVIWDHDSWRIVFGFLLLYKSHFLSYKMMAYRIFPLGSKRTHGRGVLKKHPHHPMK